MEKIIVATDLSKNSKFGLKFAIQLASQYKLKLVFFNAVELLIPTRWNDVKSKIHMDEEIQRETDNLRKFVAQTYKECRRQPGKFDCVVRYGAPVSQAILEYAEESGASYICMGTHGAGKLRRLVGTHTAAVIKKSAVPVFAVPKNYKASVIKEILYASDFTTWRNELRRVKNFAKKIDSSVSVLHYDYPKAAHRAFEHSTNRRGLANTRIHLEVFNRDEPMSWHLKKAARKFKADVIAMFTDGKRPWLQKMIQGSNAVNASFDMLRPLLVYPK